MTRKLTILLFLLALVSAWASSPDFIDDVYYWDDDSQPVAPIVSAEEKQSTINNQQSTIIFIEDSITQHSDTIVKAIIRR